MRCSCFVTAHTDSRRALISRMVPDIDGQSCLNSCCCCCVLFCCPVRDIVLQTHVSKRLAAFACYSAVGGSWFRIFYNAHRQPMHTYLLHCARHSWFKSRGCFALFCRLVRDIVVRVHVGNVRVLLLAILRWEDEGSSCNDWWDVRVFLFAILRREVVV